MDSKRAVEVLFEKDATFNDFATTVLKVNSAEALWEALYTPGGVSKMSPDSSEMHAPEPVKAVKPVKPVEEEKSSGTLKPTGKKKDSKKDKDVEKSSPRGRLTLREVGEKAREGAWEVEPLAEREQKKRKQRRKQPVRKGLKMPNWKQVGADAKSLGKGAPWLVGGVGLGVGSAKVREKVRQKKAGVPAPQSEYIENSSFNIVKSDDDKQQVFGWASVIAKDGQEVLDKQGDIIGPDEMEKSAYRFVLESRKGGQQHKRTEDDQPLHVSDMIESMAFTPEKIEKMGLPPTTPVGWWVGFQVNDPNTWADVKNGKVTSFSIHGRGRRVPVE